MEFIHNMLIKFLTRLNAYFKGFLRYEKGEKEVLSTTYKNIVDKFEGLIT
ncbi:DNA helicase UvrD/Rep family protein [Weissella oryzae SG25]|uniref:DNA helicase UvrD/Rep family protein n=1 Tax=Weissella oryzae (strain DSM 25784 / JCM 18191 / LMG 30913 / SG25) TaxID=1329250 RepID=A0A069CR02_WEIOS|nr:DNA helicase UvrD/Rep family protein [Weissella oryzae SG25]